MKFKTFFVKKILMSFFVSATCISAAMAIIGMIFEPNTRFGYGGLFSPLLFGAISTIPSMITYSKKELSIAQMAVRKCIQLVLLESMILSILYFGGALKNSSVTISLALSILVISITVYAVLWVNDKRTAKELNEALKKMQNR